MASITLIGQMVDDGTKFIITMQLFRPNVTVVDVAAVFFFGFGCCYVRHSELLKSTIFKRFTTDFHRLWSFSFIPRF